MSPKKIPASPSEIGITKLGVGGFKSIDTYIEADIKPLTILAGANSSGKSSFMQPLLLMKQTLECSYNPGVFLLNGPNCKFTDSKQFFSHKNIPITIFVEFSRNSQKSSFKTRISRIHKQHLSIKSTEYKATGNKANFLVYKNMTPKEFKEIYKAKNISIEDNAIPVTVENLFFLEPILAQKNNTDIFYEAGHYINALYGFNHYKNIIAIKDTFHLPGLRGTPERNYNSANVSAGFSGVFVNYFASVLHEWHENNIQKLEELNSQMGLLGLTSLVKAKKINEAQIEINVGRLPEAQNPKDLVNIADVGFGVSQVLPVLVALLVAEPGQLVYIEQPELHLHPKAQMHLPEILATAAKRGVRVVIETHSEIILRGVQTLIAEGELDHNIVAMHWFERDQKTGSTTIRTADLDEYGRFGDWPEDFSSTMMKVENRYFDAAEEKLKRDSQKS